MGKSTRLVWLLIGLFLGGLLSPTGVSVARAGQVEKTDLFVSGEGGYKLYRIPGIVVSATGTVLAYCEARRGDSGDWGTIDVQLPDGRMLCFYERGSTDGENNYRPGRLTVARFDEEWVRARP